jgi:hypothetical protein
MRPSARQQTSLATAQVGMGTRTGHGVVTTVGHLYPHPRHRFTKHRHHSTGAHKLRTRHSYHTPLRPKPCALTTLCIRQAPSSLTMLLHKRASVCPPLHARCLPRCPLAHPRSPCCRTNTHADDVYAHMRARSFAHPHPPCCRASAPRRPAHPCTRASPTLARVLHPPSTIPV